VGALSREIRAVQNPALGAAILWRFVCGYEAGNNLGIGTPVLLLFLVLPIMLDEDLAALLARTQRHTGLRGFVGKISDSKTSKTDLLYAVQTRSEQYKNSLLSR
jgi:hypothetical protein